MINSRSLGWVVRSCECAVKSSRGATALQTRSFSSSPLLCSKGVPVFTDTSSPELNELLTSIRTRIFLPYYVSKGQRNLIVKAKYAKSLETEPVKAVIAGESFTLTHVDPLGDVIGKKRALAHAMALMKEKRDWDNLPNLIEGLRKSRYPLPLAVKLRALRKVGSAGHYSVMLECLRRVSDTGIDLKDPEFAVQVIWWFMHKAVVNDFDAEHTKKALSWAEIARNMMEDPAHMAKPAPAPEDDPRNQPQVTGILLQLAAVRAAKHQDGKDEDGKVAAYAKRLLELPVASKSPEPGTFAEPNVWLSTHIPVLHGIKLAQTILGPSADIAPQLQSRSSKLEELIVANKAILDQRILEREVKQDKPSTSTWLYEKLLGSEASL